MDQTKTIECLDDIAIGLAMLNQADTRLADVIANAGDVPLRRTEPGFEGLVRIIVAQQVSKASADAIMARTETYLDPFEPEAYLQTSDETRRAMGLSRPKQRTMQAISEAVVSGQLDLLHITSLPATDAIVTLTEIKGIGPWTAEVYLLFCAGHPDIFPAGDLALQIAVHEALQLNQRPDEKSLRQLAESWAPWRSVAARLFWAWYATARNRAVMP